MEPQHIPDVEIFIAVKWILLLMLASGLMTWSALIVKRWWYGEQKPNRRQSDLEDPEPEKPANEANWMKRFLDNQERYTKATLELKDEMHGVREALTDNGDAIRSLAESVQCKYNERHVR